MRCVLAALVLGACSDPPAKPSPLIEEHPSETPTDTGLSGGTTGSTDSATPGDSGPTDTGPAESDEPGDTPETARALPRPDPRWTVSGTVDSPGDADWYAVPLDAGDTLWIAVLAELRSEPSPLAATLTVVAPSGTTTGPVRGMPLSIGGPDPALAFEATESGTHFVVVAAAEPTEGGAEHVYSLVAEQTEPFEVEPHNDTPEAMAAWLALDDTYAYFGDPFIAGWPLFSVRADHPTDVDVLPWTVRGELADGRPAAAELWSYGPWPGSNTAATWSVVHDTVGTLATAAHLSIEPLWHEARRGQPLLPDVGMLVASPPGELQLHIVADPAVTGIGSAATGVLAGWTMDGVDLQDALPADVLGEKTPPFRERGDGSSVAAVWGQLDGSDVVLGLSVDPDRPVWSVYVQAQGIGGAVDPTLLLQGSALDLTVSDSPLDGRPDPEVFDLDLTGETAVRLTLSGTPDSAAGYLLQVHATAAPVHGGAPASHSASIQPASSLARPLSWSRAVVPR